MEGDDKDKLWGSTPDNLHVSIVVCHADGEDEMNKRSKSLERLSTHSVNSSRTTDGAFQAGPATPGSQESPRAPKVPPRPSAEALSRLKLQKQSYASNSLPRPAARVNYTNVDVSNPSGSVCGERVGDGRVAAAVASPLSSRQALSKSTSQIAEGSPRSSKPRYIRESKPGARVLRRKSTPPSPKPRSLGVSFLSSALFGNRSSPAHRRSSVPVQAQEQKPDASLPQTGAPRKASSTPFHTRSMEECSPAHSSSSESHTAEPSTSESPVSTRVTDARKEKIYKSMTESVPPGGNISTDPQSSLEDFKQPNLTEEMNGEQQGLAQPLYSEIQSATATSTQPRRPPPSRNPPSRPPPPIPRSRRPNLHFAAVAAVAPQQPEEQEGSPPLASDYVIMSASPPIGAADRERKENDISSSQDYVVMTAPSSVETARGEGHALSSSFPSTQDMASSAVSQTSAAREKEEDVKGKNIVQAKEGKEEEDIDDGAYCYIDLQKNRSWMAPPHQRNSSSSKTEQDVSGPSTYMSLTMATTNTSIREEVYMNPDMSDTTRPVSTGSLPNSEEQSSPTVEGTAADEHIYMVPGDQVYYDGSGAAIPLATSDTYAQLTAVTRQEEAVYMACATSPTPPTSPLSSSHLHS